MPAIARCFENKILEQVPWSLFVHLKCFDASSMNWHTDLSLLPSLYIQYEENCLDVALFLLQTLTANECRRASAVARAITAGVNSRDNSGIMAASYTGGTHMGGIHPCRWNGSTAILQKFYRTKTPVRYVLPTVDCDIQLHTPTICTNRMKSV